MRALVYHYVRPGAAESPRFRYLHLDDFRRQLDALAATGRLLSRAAFLDKLETGRFTPQDILLTFDDALRDHYTYVLPELLARDVMGVFYVPTAIYEENAFLDVHLIHLLTGRFDPTMLLKRLGELVSEAMLTDKGRAGFDAETYTVTATDQATDRFKRICNYYLDYAHRSRVLAALAADLVDVAAERERYYMTREQLRDLAQTQLVGSHGQRHLVFSKLDEALQQQEIQDSFAWLDAHLPAQPLRTFCYPYGGFHTFTPVTERLLTEAGCRFSFNVEPRDVAWEDWRSRPQALPRWDCNLFPYGKARIGAGTTCLAHAEDR